MCQKEKGCTWSNRSSVKTKQNIRSPAMSTLLNWVCSEYIKKRYQRKFEGLRTEQKLTNFVKFARVLWKEVYISRGLAPIWSLWQIVVGRRMWELPWYSRLRVDSFCSTESVEETEKWSGEVANESARDCQPEGLRAKVKGEIAVSRRLARHFAARFWCFINWFWGTERDCSQSMILSSQPCLFECGSKIRDFRSNFPVRPIYFQFAWPTVSKPRKSCENQNQISALRSNACQLPISTTPESCPKSAEVTVSAKVK